MIAMRPIAEAAVLEDLNAGRFSGALQGYVIMDTETMSYEGHFLYRVDGAVTTVLDCSVSSTALVDGGVRACVAAGEHTGAHSFAVNTQVEALRKWADIFVKQENFPLSNNKIFKQCK